MKYFVKSAIIRMVMFKMVIVICGSAWYAGFADVAVGQAITVENTT